MTDKFTPNAAIFLALFIFALVVVATDWFRQPQVVATSDVTVRTTAPGAGDDVTLGIMPGLLWIDLDPVPGDSDLYVNVDNTDGAAVWIQID
jgi:hypothetical protein